MTTLPKARDRFLTLVRAVECGTTARSENELSRRFADVLEGLGLATVVDTGQAGSRKRPDILAYCDPVDADLVLHADVVVESKTPDEVKGYADLGVALAEGLWQGKTIPYIQQSISRIRYFVLTSFVEFAFLRVTEALRAEFSRRSPTDLATDTALQAKVRSEVHLVSLASSSGAGRQAAERAWSAWLDTHLRPGILAPLELSAMAKTAPLRTHSDLELFATRLAELAAGTPESSYVAAARAGLFGSIRARLPDNYNLLDGETKKDLHLFVMSQQPSADLDTVGKIVSEDPDRWLDDFVAASIHSLVSRLFALSVIEDLFCLDDTNPLIERELLVVNVKAYDGLDAERLVAAVTAAVRRLKESANPVAKRLAVFGAFFDWIERYLDPVLFRPLFELFVTHDFRQLDLDLLGRFFEIYAQRINATRRRALGQYYTPLPVVRYMWRITLDALAARNVELPAVTVLDPAMGSGTFLKEGANALGRAHVPSFWQNLVGFDISPQVMGIAQVNFYISVLSNVPREDALRVADLRLYTTDALDPRNGRYLKQVQPLFDDATHREFLQRVIEVSSRIKRHDHFPVVVGNPPYKNNSALTLAQVAERFPRLLSSSVAGARAQVRNIRDDYAWFFAAADAYVSDRGHICYITSDSYTRTSSYRFLREELLRHYEVLQLVRLGTHVFPDVSHRISFVIIHLARREQPLGNAEDAAPFPFYDLRSLAEETGPEFLATPDDPRFRLLEAVTAGTGSLPAPLMVHPARAHDFVLLPVSESVVNRVQTEGVPVFAKQGNRLFVAKWPGVITAFDALLKGEDRGELVERLSSYFAVAHRHRRNVRALEDALGKWAAGHGIRQDDTPRLVSVALAAGQNGIAFDETKIKRSASGSIPNELRWYPPPKFRHWIYYEPAINIPRNVNPGKFEGWGWMQQWREPASHTIRPKLIFTTTTNPKSGYKAFVVDDEWYVKLHGGTSQQYNYTGLVNPLMPLTTSGVENNLTPFGERLRTLLLDGGGVAEDLLHYIAAIYNSALAQEFLEEESSHNLQIRIPSGRRAAERSLNLASAGRRQRDLHRLLYDCPKNSQVAASTMLALAPEALLSELGFVLSAERRGRYRPSNTYSLPGDIEEILTAEIARGQETVDEMVELLYS